MRREEYEDRGFIPDYVITQRALKRRLGITERRMIRNVDTTYSSDITIDLGIEENRRVKYHIPQQEFKDSLGITGNITMILASVWNHDIQITLHDTHPVKAVRIT